MRRVFSPPFHCYRHIWLLLLWLFPYQYTVGAYGVRRDMRNREPKRRQLVHYCGQSEEKWKFKNVPILSQLNGRCEHILQCHRTRSELFHSVNPSCCCSWYGDRIQISRRYLRACESQRFLSILQGQAGRWSITMFWDSIRTSLQTSFTHSNTFLIHSWLSQSVASHHKTSKRHHRQCQWMKALLWVIEGQHRLIGPDILKSFLPVTLRAAAERSRKQKFINYGLDLSISELSVLTHSDSRILCRMISLLLITDATILNEKSFICAQLTAAFPPRFRISKPAWVARGCLNKQR